MKIALIVLADIFIIAIAIMAVNEYFGFSRYARFTVPFTEKMMQLGVLSEEKGKAIISEDKITHIIGMVIAVIAAGMMAKFIAGISGVIVFIAVAAAMLAFIHPDMTETTATRTGYYNAHHSAMDIRRYHEYLVSVGDANDADPIA